MDRPDEEFESYLRQFQLRTPGPLNEQVQLTSRRPILRFARWAVAAVILVAAVVTSVRLIRVSGISTGAYAVVENSGSPSLYRNGQRMEAGEIVRSNSSKGLVLRLENGSQIEMRSESVLAMESASDGAQIRLDSGSIIVNATRQKLGHLYVKTHDALVSVDGTESMVDADTRGTRVAVMQGEVQVDHGGKWDKLRSGEQFATSASMPLISIREGISWSRNATLYLTMLPQAPAAETPRPPASAAARQNETPVSVPPLPPLPPLPQDAPAVVVSPPTVPPGSDDLEKACGSCHLASVAYSIAPKIDIHALERNQIELAARSKQLRERYGDAYPGVQSSQSQIKQLDDQLGSAKAAVSDYVLKHNKMIGGAVSDQDLSAIVESIFRSGSAVPTSPSRPQQFK
jgi:hypothetical protein